MNADTPNRKTIKQFRLELLEYLDDLGTYADITAFIGPYITGGLTNLAIRYELQKLVAEDLISCNGYDELAVRLGGEYKPLHTLSIAGSIILKGEEYLHSQIRNANPLLPKEPLPATKEYTKVFIVHGHDNEAKTEVARLIERLGIEAIILHEQANQGKTIIEKIEQYGNVDFAIILYTPCDIGNVKSKPETMRPRARQNVLLEHGFFIGKLGRSNVAALVKGDIDLPSDASGIVYIPMDEGDSWHYKIAKELKQAGFKLDMNNI